MQTTQIFMQVPNDLFPLVAHAVKYAMELFDVTSTECKAYIDSKVHKDHTPMTYCSQMRDYMLIRPNFAAQLVATIETKENGRYGLWVDVADGKTELNFGPTEGQGIEEEGY